LCRWAPPSGSVSRYSSGYAASCADGLRPREASLGIPAAMPPPVPMGSALGQRFSVFQRLRRLLCRWAPPSGSVSRYSGGYAARVPMSFALGKRLSVPRLGGEAALRNQAPSAAEPLGIP
ncbi:MAG: hypothetical protein WAV47_06785, partial [Blastocatellia bacterium]